MNRTDMAMSTTSPRLLNNLPPPSRRSSGVRSVSLAPPHSPSSPSSVVGETMARIRSSGVIACLRANTAESAMEAARAAITGGISVLEIVTSTPGVFEVVQQLVHDYPTTVFGVGTVLSLEDAEKAARVGAKFFMSPAMVKDVLDRFKNRDVLYIPGAMTPTEILTAYEAGANIIKVYPVSALGGVKYISAIKKPFSHIPMVASQGITIDSVGKYIANGAASAVLSDAIFDKELMSQNNFKAMHQLAHLATLEGSEAVER